MEKKVLYIIIGVVVVAVLALGLGMKMMWKTAGLDYQQNADGTQTYTNNDGTVTVGTGASMPSSWPADAPVNYAGAEILYSGNSNPQTGSSGAMVSYTVKNAKPADVALYYRQNLGTKGWTITGDAALNGQFIVGATKDTRTFAVSISDAANGVVTVTAGLEL